MRILSYILFISIFLFGCNTEKNKVEKTATQYLQYLKDKNYEEVEKLQLETCKGFLSCASEYGFDYNITVVKDVNCEVKENEANCTYCCGDTTILSHHISLKKVNDNWFVTCPKETPPCYNDSLESSTNN